MMELPDHIMPVTWGTLTQIGTHQSEHCSYVANKQASSATGNAPIILNQNDLNWRHIGDNHHYILLAIFLASICIWGLMKQITYKFLIVIKQIRQHKKTSVLKWYRTIYWWWNNNNQKEWQFFIHLLQESDLQMKCHNSNIICKGRHQMSSIKLTCHWSWWTYQLIVSQSHQKAVIFYIFRYIVELHLAIDYIVSMLVIFLHSHLRTLLPEAGISGRYK